MYEQKQRDGIETKIRADWQIIKPVRWVPRVVKQKKLDMEAQ